MHLFHWWKYYNIAKDSTALTGRSCVWCHLHEIYVLGPGSDPEQYWTRIDCDTFAESVQEGMKHSETDETKYIPQPNCVY